VPRTRIAGTVVAALGLAWGTAAALRVGYPDASGIVEEGLGGAGTRIALLAILAGIPAVVVGLLDGLTALMADRTPRAVLRVAAPSVVGLWAGLWIYGFATIECDGTCRSADAGPVLATLAAAVVVVLVEWGVATVVGVPVARRAAHRAAERSVG